MATPTHDVIVVGGSYAGLSAGLQLARARRRVLLIDGGLRRNRTARAAHGVLGHDGRAPGEIVRLGAEQLLAYPNARMIEATARRASAAADADGFTIILDDGREERARRLVLATGLRDELPPIAGLAERWGTSVAICPLCHGYEVAGRPLGVSATHPMSAHQAVQLPDWGPTTFFTQGTFEPAAEHTALFAARSVRIERSPVVELLGAALELEAVRLADGRTIPLAMAFVASRTQMASDLAAQLGCAVEEGVLGPMLRTDDWKETSTAGVFAAGDMGVPMHAISLAAASGALAGAGAHRSLVPGLGTLAPWWKPPHRAVAEAGA